MDEERQTKTRRQARPKAPHVTVEVTRQIIDSAEQRDSSHCMIAEAVRAAVPNAKSVSVDLQTVRYSDPDRGLRYTYLTPRHAQVALVSFDQGIHTDPFTMVLKGGQVTKMGKAGEGYKRRRAAGGQKGPEMPDGQKQELVARHTTATGTPIPEVVGGKTPPVGPLSNTTFRGKRRAFGLRGLHL